MQRHAVTIIDGKIADDDVKRLKNMGVDPATVLIGDVPAETVKVRAKKTMADEAETPENKE